MQQANTFPLTILMKEGKLQVISTLSPELTTPLIKRAIQELEVPYQNRYFSPETEGEDGTPNPLFEIFEKIDVDALCVLSQDGEFVFVLNSAYQLHDTAKYQQLMREKLKLLNDN